MLALDPLSCDGAAGDGRATAECLRKTHITLGPLNVRHGRGGAEATIRGRGLKRLTLNTASSMVPSAPTLICSFMTSPHAGAPTSPVPTRGSFLSREPTFRGRS
jgi:hypothetical protein